MKVSHEISTPTTVMDDGSTGSGKTELVFKILLLDKSVLPSSARIMYHYGAWQKRFAEVEAADQRVDLSKVSPSLMTYQAGSNALLWLLMT